MEKPEQVSISLTDFEKKVVNEVSAKRGIFNFSAAIRLIIREWAQLQEEELSKTGITTTDTTNG